jgi:hypothetical protein
MRIGKILERLAQKREEVAIYGLGFVVLVAGVSKFFEPGVWAAYEPGFVTQFSPVDATIHMYMAGIVESAAGIMLFLRKRVFEVSAFLTFWLAGITAGVLSMGFWSIALRDLGLVFLTVYVALHAYDAEEN